jgi:hypothetical protein
MSDDNEHMALSVLLAAAAEFAPDIPEDIFKKAYAIQKARQFDRERDVSLQEMNKLVDDYLGQSGAGVLGRQT